MLRFITFAFTPAGLADPALAIAACRAGGIGVLNAELAAQPGDVVVGLERLCAHAGSAYGLKLDAIDGQLEAGVRAHARRGLRWLIVDAEMLPDAMPLIEELRRDGVQALVEVRTPAFDVPSYEARIDGLLIKGNESGGFVGEDSSFILLQKWRGQTRLPLYVRGGLTPPVAAACAAVGVAGGVLDSQLLLMDEVRLPEPLRQTLRALSGSETVAVGDGERGEYFRLLVRPGLAAARQFVASGEGQAFKALREQVGGRAHWPAPDEALLPIGQDVAFAAPWRKRYGHVAAVLRAIEEAVQQLPHRAAKNAAIAEHSPLARALGLRLPIVQGPMTRVSDTAEFACAIADGGALPMVALALLKGAALEQLLARTAELLGERPWGIGLLGFAPQSLLDEQLAVAVKSRPRYAIIAGGRPDQAVHLERTGVPTFLHVPSASLIPGFLQEGARRFIFEGRECGGHIGPLSSFVLWSSMVERLLAELPVAKLAAQELELVFAGGIHDAVSSAMVQVIAAPLASAGAKVGILMGSAYLFTEEIVATGAIVPVFQQEVLACERTVNLESGPGHASRCAHTRFASEFFAQRAEMRRAGMPGEEVRRALDDLILGRLRIASKGSKRDGPNGSLQPIEPERQRDEGMYMLGQVATLRRQVTRIDTLHREVSVGAASLLASGLAPAPVAAAPQAPADIAVVGIATVLPKANSTREFWDNIVAKVDAITEIPPHRWDWRLYFDPDRRAKDRIYSKWGGFLDDLPFDPTRYGMPPKSVEAVDPMQLMGLEVAYRALADAGYHDKAFDREKASVIIGASGGAGDFGLQYGLRSEWPRFGGQLPAEVAARLPEWTEDSFAGILPNVVAGRIANRLNFGGANLAVDAACASSLAAVYQGVNDLVAGRSDLVIAGGVDTVQGPFGYLCFSKTQALSPRGRCSTFDAGGDGIVISEGIAMVVLKRLADAQRDGDRIYAVIKGVGASSDGNAKGLTAPLPAGQLRAMRRAYDMAGFAASTVGLFEAHGTGTVAGDTAELESTMRLMAEQGGRARSAVIGSVKTNIGHTKASAGMAGLVKALLALHHRVLPPHLHMVTPNPVLADPAAPLYVLDEPRPWLAPADMPRRAACSAFGFGGTNFHVALEEYTQEYRDWMRPPACDAWSAELLLWSDTGPSALRAALESFSPRLAQADGVLLRDLAASLAAHWRPQGHTLAIVARSIEDLRPKLAAAIDYLGAHAKALPPGVYHGVAPRPAGKVAVLFPGQGSQYPAMAREAALHFEPVAAAMSRADAALRDAFEARFGAAARLSQFIFPRGAYDEAAKTAARQALTRTDVAQPALGAVEAGLYTLMQSLGLRPDMLGGHSYGEFVALFAAGAIDFDALMQLSAARGRFIVDAAAAQNAELGTMAAANADRKVVEDAIADLDDVVIANHNAPLQSILSGTRAGVKKACEKLREAGVEVSDIPVAAAFHSRLVRPAQEPLAQLIDSLTWHAPGVPVYSNTTARPHASEVARIKRQMAEHLVKPVEFVAQIEAMYAEGARVFVEVGPKNVLSRLTSRILEGKPHVAIATDDGSGLPGLLAGLGQLVCAGVELDVAALFARRDCRIGDPAQPEKLRRAEQRSPHTWMLNGSGARRAGEPVRQIGVTLEQAQAQGPAQVAAAPVASAPPQMQTQAQPQGQEPLRAQAQAPTASVAARAAPDVLPPRAASPQERQALTRSTTVMRRERSMDERRPVPVMADASVMTDYFATMRQFLETQERVMSSFLGSVPNAMPALRPRALPPSLPRVAELPQVAAAVPAVAPPIEVARAVATVAPATEVAPPVEPLAATVPAAATVVAPSAVPRTEAPKTVAAQASAEPAGAAEGLTRDRLVDMLLGIVEEKTGYPRDMVGLDQNLEADLGIDSIKRVEVVGALLQGLPAKLRESLKDSRSKLNTQSTLNGMLELVGQIKGDVAVPFESAGAGSGAESVGHPPRHVMRPRRETLPDDAVRRLTPGRFVITADPLGVAPLLAAALRERGCEAVLLEAEPLATEASCIEQARVLARSAVAGVVHLAPLGAPGLSGQESPTAWRQALHQHERSLFLLLRELGAALVPRAHVVAASALGGLFGREGTAAPELRLCSGAVGALKSLREERESLRVKAVDLDPRRSAGQLAQELLAEMEVEGGRQEVGYPGGERTVFVSVAQGVGNDASPLQGTQPSVVLATGGARGITAEALRELARPGVTLVLTGRTPLPPQEPDETAALADTEALRRHHVEQVRAGRAAWTPADIERQVQRILGLREIRANLQDFARAGAAVEYHAVDVTDEAAVQALVQDVLRRHGCIDAVVHGAGVIEDRRLDDKTAQSWSRVVETKVIGLLLLQKHVPHDGLRFFCAFSSVAGRYGNSGQTDYATANELMNRLCQSLQARWGPRVVVSALCWGPWDATRFGAGMVTAETQAKFAARGVRLVAPALGRRLFREELQRGAGGAVEVICGEADWDRHEAQRGQLLTGPATPGPAPMGPLLGAASPVTRANGERIIALRLDPRRHLYLQEHALDGKMVLPAAAALELIAEAAAALWPGWRVTEVREHKLLKGVELDGGVRELQLLMRPPPYGSSEGFEVSAALQSELGAGRTLTHYRSIVHLAPSLPAALPQRRCEHRERTLSVAQAYGQWLFHGPRLQVIESIAGLSSAGAEADVRSTQPSQWLRDDPGGAWVFDPALLDAAAQMAWLWARAFREESALPARFGRVVRYRERRPTRLRMEYERVPTADPALIRGNVLFTDEHGEPVLAIEELDSIASAALNRLGGTARAAEDAPA